ncbi:homocysteine S-methyltransferase family protein [Yoonia sp. BS5-3]|uniref:Homocysteine S-methyltransferase family protein n=1 Tax=Yoonia phaeophyticola TaxID=3137369 RepID=A0ABZ2V6M5_9RHOB
MTQITLMDGGLGQELVRRASDKPTNLWSTQVMIDHPGLVAAVHRDYREAGARVHVANTYALHRDRLTDTPHADQFEALHDMALREVRSVCVGHGRIAGSLGPLIASYRPDLHPPHDEAVQLYAEVTALLAPHVDVVIGETIASVAHARAVLEAALPFGKPVWLSMTVQDGDGSKLRSGEDLSEVLSLAGDGAAALLANCAPPETMATAVNILATGDLPFGAFANGFTHIADDFLKDKPTVDALSARQDLTPEAYAKFALGWIDQGATIVGGCCEVGPAHIAALAKAITDAGHRIN